MEATQLPPLNDVNFNLFFNRVLAGVPRPSHHYL
jgi:hypothetical protein